LKQILATEPKKPASAKGPKPAKRSLFNKGSYSYKELNTSTCEALREYKQGINNNSFVSTKFSTSTATVKILTNLHKCHDYESCMAMHLNNLKELGLSTR
jgi:hypothetical protein